jgi:hypothetical protein
MVANGNVAKRVSNEASISSSPTQKVKGDKKKLVVLNIDDVVVKMQGACFEGKVMNRYGSWDIGQSTYKCFKADLVDHDSFQTVTLVISESFASHHSNKIHVGKYIKIINFSCGAKSKYEHGDNPRVIKISLLSTKILKIATFPI